MNKRLMITDPVHVAQVRVMYHEHVSVPDWSFQFVAKEHYGEWRWGNLYLLVIRDAYDQSLWGTVVEEQTGDNYYLSLDEAKEIDFKPVREVQTVSYEIVKV